MTSSLPVGVLQGYTEYHNSRYQPRYPLLASAAATTQTILAILAPMPKRSCLRVSLDHDQTTGAGFTLRALLGLQGRQDGRVASGCTFRLTLCHALVPHLFWSWYRR